jgi:YD repeat-containing protein
MHRVIAAACLLLVLLFVPNATGQATCNTDPWPPINSCTRVFSIWPGDYAPMGAHCWCDGVPRVSADCYVPQCIKNPPTNCPTCGGHPINLSNGNTYIQQTDVKLPGLGGGLTLTRSWNSIPATGPGPGLFGPNWQSTYEERILLDSDNTVAYLRSDGSKWSFVWTGSRNYSPVAPANTTATLSQGTSTWTLTLRDGEQRTFDNSNGYLLLISDRNGNTTQLSYDTSYRLVSVADAAGRHLYFSYASTSGYLVTAVSSDFGVSLSYMYDGQGRLIRVTEPDLSTLSFTYDASSRVSSVTDSNGKVLESHTYDDQGRGLTSSRALGVDAITVTYPPPLGITN